MPISIDIARFSLHIAHDKRSFSSECLRIQCISIVWTKLIEIHNFRTKKTGGISQFVDWLEFDSTICTHQPKCEGIFRIGSGPRPTTGIVWFSNESIISFSVLIEFDCVIAPKCILWRADFDKTIIRLFEFNVWKNTLNIQIQFYDVRMHFTMACISYGIRITKLRLQKLKIKKI